MRETIYTGLNARTKFLRSVPFLFMLLPGFIFVLVLSYLPMTGLIIAFKKLRFHGGFINSVLTSEWVGFDNFRFLFSTADAWIITRNTILYNLSFIFTGTVCAIALAIALSYLKRPVLRSFYQTAVLFPNFISWVVVSYFSLALLHPSNGVINHILSGLGITPIEWYSTTKPWPAILLITNTWKAVGFSAALYLASILSIDQSLYEAARIDGASVLQQIFKITLPLMQKLIIVLTLLALGGIFRADFGLFFQIPRDVGTLYPVTDVIDTYVYRGLAVSGDIPMTVATGLYQSIVGFILILVSNAVVKKIDSESGIY